MKLIVITSEEFPHGESMAINRMFEDGLEILHLRKPHSSIDAVERLIKQIDASFHQHIVVHDHFSLVEMFDLRGVHLNMRNTATPQKEGFSVSRSCHSFEDIVSFRAYDYVFLSPVFDSISKIGYSCRFTPEQLYDAKNEGIINEKVMALGGVTPEKIPLVRQYGFGGAVVLGTLWNDFLKIGDTDDLIRRFKELKIKCEEE